MRKVIALLVVAAAIGFYVVHISNIGKSTQDPTSKTETVGKKDGTKAGKKLKAYKEQLTKNYPESPADVMKVYNELLNIAYSDSMSDEEAHEYVKITRMLYSTALNNLNPEESQYNGLVAEIMAAQKSGIQMVASNIGAVYVLTDEKGNPKQATVTVTHAMTDRGDTRKYIFVKENGLWKINSWESIPKTTTEE